MNILFVKELWHNQPNIVIELGLAIVVLLGFKKIT